MKNIVFITESELLTDYPELYDELCIEPKDIENGYILDFWIDCDYIKVNGESGRGSAPFVKIENEKEIIIVSMFELDDDEQEIINWWLMGATDEQEIENNWNDWDKVKTGVAYRGGSGYFYALYTKEMI